MEPISRIDEDLASSVAVESVQPELTTIHMLSLLFYNSMPAIDILAEKKLAPLKVKIVELQIACFIASIVLKCWDQIIEDQAKEAEIAKVAAKKTDQHRAEIKYRQLMDQIKKEEIHKDYLSRCLSLSR